MKHIAIVFVLLASVGISFAQPTWQWQNPLPQGNPINAITATDIDNAWAVGDLGTLLRTSNGGLTWLLRSVGIRTNLSNITFTDTKNGWVAGDSGIFHSSDGGITWLNQTSKTNGLTYGYMALQFIDTNTGWAIGGSSIIVRTTNGGVTWTTLTVPNVANIVDLSFADSKNGWLVSDKGILHTSDGGVTWVQQTLTSTPSTFQFIGLSFADSLNGIAYGNYWVTTGGMNRNLGTFFYTTNGGVDWESGGGIDIYIVKAKLFDAKNGKAICGEEILLTSDGGYSWSRQNPGIPIVNKVFFLNKKIGWAVNGADIYHWTDGGFTIEDQIKGSTMPLNAICFIDSNKGWVAGDSILHTTDGGNTWVSQKPGIGMGFNNMVFVDSNNGWGVSGNGTIRHTSNSGNSWECQYSCGYVTVPPLYGLYFIDTNYGWADGWDGAILRTTNGGNTWITDSLGINYTFSDITFADNMNGWAVGEYGLIFHTTDGGNSWIKQSTTINNNIFHMSVFFINAKIGWVAGDNGEIFHTIDSGNSWVKQFSNGSTSIFFLDSNIGWNGGNRPGKILHTTNSGITWQFEDTPFDGIAKIAYTSPQNGWIIGGGGSILHTSNGSSFSGVKFPIKNNSLPLNLQNYPNPLNSITTFNYNIPKTSFVSLRIMNALGEEVSRLISQVESEGIHEAKWDVHDMPNGIYFCELRAGEYSQSVRVIVAK